MAMPRALKTFVTTLGFFELAVAAPSMKAALKAWGLERNAFQHGFARQTDDPKIIAAAEANPGSVLKRPIGSKDEFKEDASLPKASAAKTAAPLPKITKPAKRPTAREDKAKPDASVIRLDAVRHAREELKAKQREREEAQQAKERAREEARAEAEAERARAQRQRAIEKAADALSAARSRHADAVAEIDQQRAALDALEEKEKRRWDGERKRLESALKEAKEN
jgi:hypothetical protein